MGRGEACAGAANSVQARSTIFEQTPQQQVGLKAFTIDFKPVRGGTQVEAKNQRLPYALGQKLVADVGYWVQGGANCEGPAQATSARGSLSGPAR